MIEINKMKQNSKTLLYFTFFFLFDSNKFSKRHRMVGNLFWIASIERLKFNVKIKVFPHLIQPIIKLCFQYFFFSFSFSFKLKVTGRWAMCDSLSSNFIASMCIRLEMKIWKLFFFFFYFVLKATTIELHSSDWDDRERERES